jgi:hypothetical protein
MGVTVFWRLLNIDTFTVQMIDTKEQLRSFTKANLKSTASFQSADAVVQEHLQCARSSPTCVSYLVSLKGRATP